MCDVYTYTHTIAHTGPEIYARPETSGEIPQLPIMLQAIPWIERKSGDMLKNKDPVAKVCVCECVCVLQSSVVGSVCVCNVRSLWNIWSLVKAT